MKKDLLDILVDIAESMDSSAEMAELLPNLLTVTQTYLKVKRVSIMKIDGEYLRIIASTGLNVETSSVKIPLGKGISGKVAISGKELLINRGDVINEELGYVTSSYMSVPLKVKDNVIGVLNLTDKLDDFFYDEDIKIAKYIASQCALAIERSNLYEEKRKSDNLKIIGKFTSSIAHDIKNLLNVVQSYVELMEIETSHNSEMKEYVDSVYTEIKLIHGMTLDILDFSKNQIILKKYEFMFDEFIDEIVRHTEIMLRNCDIKFHYEISGNFSICADKDKLFRVFFNLINNSIEAVGENGELSLIVHQQDNRAICILEDSGKGIPDDILPYIFDPFYTSGKSKGTGLGLAVVKEIIIAHNGTITAESKEGEFTRFTVSIPL